VRASVAVKERRLKDFMFDFRRNYDRVVSDVYCRRCKQIR
jgi:hypothetical protein